MLPSRLPRTAQNFCSSANFRSSAGSWAKADCISVSFSEAMTRADSGEGDLSAGWCPQPTAIIITDKINHLRQ
jgi:hypothetical protein